MARPRLSRSVIALGVVSLLTDASSEMIYPLLPLFLTGTLGASAATLGFIEGLAESTAGLLKLWSGSVSDRLKRRKPLVVAGYALSSIARPLIAAATAGWHVLAVRVTDRFGKGIRGAPRDALLADVTDPAIRGRAFGFHRAMDHLGAVIGPAVAFVLLSAAVGLDVRTVFWIAAIPAVLSVVVLLVAVREEPRDVVAPPSRSPWHAAWPEIPGALRRYLGVVGLFTLAGASDTFLLLRAADLGVPVALVPVLWGVHHVVKSVLSTPAGALSDRIGRRPLIITGWSLYALTYVGFAFASTAWHVWALFLAYGAFYALTEGAEKAFVADLAPAHVRGAAFGWFHLVIAVGALPASVMFGLIWTLASPGLAFAVSGGLALIAAGLLLGQPETAGRARA